MNKYSRQIIALCAAAALLVSGCISFPTLARAAEINSRTLSLYVGKTARLKIKGASGKVKWSSSNSKVATVNSAGKVRAKSPGTAVISGRFQKKKLTCKVKVGNYITGLRLDSASSVTLQVGGSSQIKVTVKGKRILDKGVKFSSSNSNKVQVSAKGIVTAKDSGLAAVTVKTKATNKKGKKLSVKVNVYVEEDTSTAPTIEPTNIPAPSGSSTVITPSVTSTPATSQTPGASEIPVTTNPPQTLQEAVNNIPVPSASTLLAASMLVQEGDEQKTLYFINKNYKGSMQLSLFGYPLSTSASVTSMLSEIEKTGLKRYIRDENNERVLYLVDDFGKCSVMHLVTQQTIYFQVYSTDTMYQSPYALIIAKGNTLESVKIQ